MSDWTLGENKAKQSQSYLAPRILWGLKTYLKKQSQFAGVANQRKLLYERNIWQYKALAGTEKQSQFVRKESPDKC